MPILALVIVMAFSHAPVGGQVVRDSADVRVVVNDRPRWDDGDRWTVSQEPITSIGGVDGAPEFLFSGIEAVLLTRDNAVVVADRGSGQVRFFDSSGEYDRSYGSMGEGPGEFLWLDWIGVCREGRILAYDLRLARVTEVGSDPPVTWSIREDGGGSAPQQVQCLGDGFVGITRILPAPRPGPMRGLARLEFFGTGSELRTKEVPGDERYFRPPNLGPRPMGRRTVIASSGELVALGTQDMPEVSLYDDRAVLQRVVRWTGEELDVRDDDIEAYVEGLIEDAPPERAAAIRGSYRDHEFPTALPAFGRLIFDQTGNLWVERTRRPGQSGNSWRVIAPSGALLGSVDLPERFDPMYISATRVAGVWRDELDVEYVWVLEISKGHPG